jgi:diguanylate cyclase (GGDEF)-like protein
MDRLAESEIRRRARYPSALAVGIIDADHFKEINNRFLLPGGDQVLIELSKTLTASLRTVDSVGRIGGEEFLVVAPETSTEGAASLGERIRSAVETSHYLYKGEHIKVTVSGGFAVAEASIASDYDQLKHYAAAALAEAKAKGRNRMVIRSLTAET